MPDQITQLLDQIDKLDQAATKGPWGAESYIWKPGRPLPDHKRHAIRSKEGEIASIRDADCEEPQNMELLSLSRTALPALSKAVRAVLAECDRFQKSATALHENPLAGHSDNVRADAWRVMAAFITEEITDALGADND